MFEFFGGVLWVLSNAGSVVENLGKIAEGGKRLFDFADAILGRVREKVPPDRQQAVIREALHEAAALPQPEFEKKINGLVDHVLEGKPPEDRKAAAEYLKLWPARIRTTFQRPEDPTGTTVPIQFAVNRPEDILGIIPPRPARFKEGDKPPGMPLCTLVDPLGMGGFGEVWKARSGSLKTIYSVFKFCLDPISQANILKNEVENIELVMEALTDHPNIVRLMHAHLDCDTPWLQYEYIAGGELTSLISTWPNDTAVRAKLAVETTKVLAETLAHCHNLKPRCVIHRDMKPANVLVSKTGVLKITDFGISDTQARQALDEARFATFAGMSMTSTTVRWANTPMYASEQQQRGERPHPSDDVHALGVMLYQMILGDVNRPLNKDYIAVLQRHRVCRELIDLVSQSIASDQAARYQDAGELLAALQSLPEKLIADPIPVDPEAGRKRMYNEIDVLYDEADERNAAAHRLFVERRWKEAERELDLILHPRMRESELDKAVRLYASGRRFKNAIGIAFAYVPHGESWLGGGGGKPGERKFVVEKGFLAGIYPVTQAEWQAVMGDSPSHFKGKPRNPVESVSWDTVTSKFLPKLNEKCLGDGYLYRLPSEEEWEYICRGGPITKDQSKFHYYFAASKTDLTPRPTNELSQSLANFGNSGSTSEVGAFPPNPLGLHDLHGNVWEWTASSEGASRVRRGGGWNDAAERCAAAYRSTGAPDRSSYNLGFRLLAVPLKDKTL